MSKELKSGEKVKASKHDSQNTSSPETIGIKKQDRILVFCAHPDDEIFGVGGTIAKYTKEGIPVSAVIFTYGEQSNPLWQMKVAAKTRVKESKNVASIIGYEDVTFFGLKEENIADKIGKKKIIGRIRKLILEKQPTKIFTHSGDDFHKVHRAVHKAVISIIEKMRYPCEIYTFCIWNPFATFKKSAPRLIVDISTTYGDKINALKRFKSQRMSYLSLIPLVYLGAVVNGFNYNMKYAEVFDRVR